MSAYPDEPPVFSVIAHNSVPALVYLRRTDGRWWALGLGSHRSTPTRWEDIDYSQFSLLRSGFRW